ncbi:hypothetical protein ACJJTC_014080 [Scirpophaga incertulas]
MSKHFMLLTLIFVIGNSKANPLEKEKDKINDTNKAVLNEIAIDPEDAGWEYENTTMIDTRRILHSRNVGSGKRPYMVYLQLTKESAKAHKYRGWLCGGVIVDPNYVLTSAACVEDADHFYIVSGTTKFVDSFDYKSDECVCKQRRRVVWKCIPKNYKFDFQDSIKWSSNDIAIVKVNKPFKLGVIEKGCDFATDLIYYNNVSRELEKPGTKGWIAGWGSGSNFREGVYRRGDDAPHIPQNAKTLQEAKVCIMDNEQCAKKWAQRFRSIITQYMICTKDVMKRLSEICEKKYANCTDVETRREDGETSNERSNVFNIDLGRHLRDPDDYTARRSSKLGGFCENDHGGPLVVKYQGKERVVGVISACKIDPKSHNCHGPFLYTSVFMNRQFIACSIHKDVEESDCRRVFRTGITHEEWSVNWDNVQEDDDEANVGRNNNNSDDIDSSDDDNKEILRGNPTRVKEKVEMKITSVTSDETEEGESKEKETNKETTVGQYKKKKSRHSKKKSRSKSAMKADVSDGITTVISTNEVFYASSKDENVNEPDDE